MAEGDWNLDTATRRTGTAEEVEADFIVERIEDNEEATVEAGSVDILRKLARTRLLIQTASWRVEKITTAKVSITTD